MIDIGRLIRLDNNTERIYFPKLFLKDRSLQKTYGVIPHYTNWNVSIEAGTLDEISFDVYKEVDGDKCPVWDRLNDFVIVSIDGECNFEAHITYTDNTETVKSVHCKSLECELGQVYLNDFHINDDEAMVYITSNYDSDGKLVDTYNDPINFDEYGNFIPTVFYNADDEEHSLLHRVIKDKAPSWSIGHVPEYVAVDEETEAEKVTEFQRTYTVDGTSIYDFLMGDVAKETNVVFLFDTKNRVINCYNAQNCYSFKTGEKVLVSSELGENTSIFVSKGNLTNEITIESNKDSLKNCFKVLGGDDLINAYVASQNLTGDNYIYNFSDIQLNDMPDELKNGLIEYQELLDSKREDYLGNQILEDFKNGKLDVRISNETDGITLLNICGYMDIYTSEITKDTFGYWYVRETTVSGRKRYELRKVGSIMPPTIEDTVSVSDLEDGCGIYTLLAIKYSEKEYVKSLMMPNISLSSTTAEDVYDDIVEKLQQDGVGVNSVNSAVLTAINNNVEAMAKVYCDARYDVKFVLNSSSYNSTTHKWLGNLFVSKIGDESDCYPKVQSGKIEIDINDNQDELMFTKQKIQKELSKGTVSGEDFDVSNKSTYEIGVYFGQYSLERLKSFSSAYESCVSILDALSEGDLYNDASLWQIRNTLRAKYQSTVIIIDGLLKTRSSQLDAINAKIDELTQEQDEFFEETNFKNFLGETLYNIFTTYVREDTYQNDNYISEGLEVSDGILKAKELLEVATKEIKKASNLQYTLSSNLHNLLILDDFKPLYNQFKQYNYITLRTDDNTYKLKLLGISLNGDSYQDINVTFAENIECLENNDVNKETRNILNDAQSIATSYSYTTLQAKQGDKANDFVGSAISSGLDATTTAINNSDNNEVTLDRQGLLCRQMLDEGEYSPEQFKLTNNIMAFTDDNWATTRLGLGKVSFYNPMTSQNEIAYGLLADAVVGKLLIGEQLYIGNDDGNVSITGEGITIKNDNNDVVFNADNSGNVFMSGDFSNVKTIETNSKLYTHWVDINTGSIIFSKATGSHTDHSDSDIYTEIETKYMIGSDMIDPDSGKPIMRSGFTIAPTSQCAFIALGYMDHSEEEEKLNTALLINNGLYWGSGEEGDIYISKNVYVGKTISSKNIYDTGWTALTCINDFTSFSSSETPRCRKVNGQVFLEGVVTPTASKPPTATVEVMFQIPSEYRPSRRLQFLCQGATHMKWLLTIDTNGNAGFSRYGDGNGYTSAQPGNWLPFNVSYAI